MRTIDLIRALAPRARPNYLAAFDRDDALAEHEIATPGRLAHFLAQVLHESGGFTVEWENMSYSASRLLEVFGERHSAKITADEARQLAHNPALIAERVYGLGNPAKAKELGNTQPGDGFRFRGGGLMQTTGRANYRATGKRCGIALEDSPDLIVAPEHALKPSLIYWTNGKLNVFADADDLLSISRAINLGNARSTRMPNGFEDRQSWLKKLQGRCADVSFGPLTRSARSTRGPKRARRSRYVGPDAPTIEPVVTAPQPQQESLPEVFELQRRLANLHLYQGGVDGYFGPVTRTALEALFMNQRVAGFERWPDERTIAAGRQLLCRIDGIDVGDIDGLVGPRTEQAFTIYAARKLNGGRPDPTVEKWRDEPEPAPPATPAPPPRPSSPAIPAANPRPSTGALPAWPRQADVATFFGPPGSGQTSLELPFRMRIAWDPGKMVTKVLCHTKVHKHLERIWLRTLQHYGLADIQRLRLDMFGGCLNVRQMRGGTNWSMHAYGIAWDVDPARNALKMTRQEATLDGPEYEAFWRFVYDEGAIGLGRERNFDWMHFQFARL